LPDRGDPVAVDQDGAILDHLVAAHGNDPRAGQRDPASRLDLAGGDAELGTSGAAPSLPPRKPPCVPTIEAVEVRPWLQ
jgi:hypothetical protein